MKDIPNFPHYQITEDGRVWSRYKKRFINPTPIGINHDYERYRLHENGKKTHIGTHKLLALTFLENPENLRIVDHIDRDKSNNSLSNLRWVSSSINNINKKLKNNKLGYRHINTRNMRNNIYYVIQIHRNNKHILTKYFNIEIYKLEEVVKYRNEVVYPQFNIEIDD